MNKRFCLCLLLILVLFIVTGCNDEKKENPIKKYPSYYSSEDTWDFKYDSMLGGTMEFTAGEVKAYLDGKYFSSYVIKGYVYRINEDLNYIYLKDNKNDDNYILIDLSSSDISKINYEDIIYVRINNTYKLLANYTDAEIIHENDIEDWDTIITVKEMIEFDSLLKETTFIVYGKIDRVSEEISKYDASKYYFITLSSNKNGYMKNGKIKEETITADIKERVDVGEYVKLSCNGANISGEFSGLDNCVLLDKGEQYKEKVIIDTE